MLRALEGAAVLLLLSLFFTYLLAPAVETVRRRVRVGPRRRPVSAAWALLLLYALILVPGVLGWRLAAEPLRHWATVTAPATVDRLFRGGEVEPIAAALAGTPLPDGVRRGVAGAGAWAAGVLEREARRTLAAGIAAAPYAGWLAVAPVVAFVLLTSAPAFKRSALRVLPRGHLQWRAEEYFRDVNSALAGYVRAQTAAALFIALVSVAGFTVIGVPSGVALGVTAGVFELIPAIGPLTSLLVTSAQTGSPLVAVLLFFVALRLLQDYVVYPRLIRRGMHLSTPAVILTLWCGAALGQAAGVILAIPVAGFLSVSLRHWREYRAIERLVAEARRSPIPNP